MSQNNPFIPLHIVEEILLNLDGKTLIQCVFICRDWNSLITSPNFISGHSNRAFDSKKEVLLIKCYRPKETKSSESVRESIVKFEGSYSLHLDNDQFDLFRTVKSPIIEGYRGLTRMGTSNGIICFVDHPPINFVLWNPTIQRYVFLPRLTLLTWDLHRSVLAFGFNRRSNDFKVVVLVCHNYEVSSIDSAYVFSYLNWSWKHVTGIPPPPPRDLKEGSFDRVLINGALHWIVWNKIEGYPFVLTFDLTHEVFGEILLPRSIANDAYSLSIMAVGDSIAVSSKKKNKFSERIWSVWIMKQYGIDGSWTNKVSTNELHPIEVLDIRKNGDIILEKRAGQFVRYNPSTSTTKVLRALDGSVFIGNHVENLCLLDKGEDVNPNQLMI
ncbi:F-box/kelch-repeat protein At3g23880-like [Neltuma alba]|uniref:F-box/kelch-repeat protein At3g23880-like n=1 Tax=Neltuma alba TaxID=207710 RepID=UPI0010A3E71B|nr:F-box/kelch-repeat protein At3g23880-like [Prosopis alba]